MKTISIYMVVLIMATAAYAQEENKVPNPNIVTKDQMEGDIFKHKDASSSIYNKTTATIDFVTLNSSDAKFVTGVYSSEALSESYPDGYGMDEFWVLLSGSITLTSEDGTVTVYNPGDACSIASEWKGRWDTEGYTKAYAVYARDEVWPTGGKIEKSK
jgi:uncharacterized cupin superfamily protein